jgi:hypothetical protein
VFQSMLFFMKLAISTSSSAENNWSEKVAVRQPHFTCKNVVPRTQRGENFDNCIGEMYVEQKRCTSGMDSNKFFLSE